MAKVSELSMQQATAMRLQQDVTERQALLERYHVNMENGLPPSVDIEQEFLRQTQFDEQRQRDRQHAKLVSYYLYLFALVSWHSGRTSVFNWRTFRVLRSTCS